MGNSNDVKEQRKKKATQGDKIKKKNQAQQQQQEKLVFTKEIKNPSSQFLESQMQSNSTNYRTQDPNSKQKGRLFDENYVASSLLQSSSPIIIREQAYEEEEGIESIYQQKRKIASYKSKSVKEEMEIDKNVSEIQKSFQFCVDFTLECIEPNNSGYLLSLPFLSSTISSANQNALPFETKDSVLAVKNLTKNMVLLEYQSFDSRWLDCPFKQRKKKVNKYIINQQQQQQSGYNKREFDSFIPPLPFNTNNKKKLVEKEDEDYTTKLMKELGYDQSKKNNKNKNFQEQQLQYEQLEPSEKNNNNQSVESSQIQDIFDSGTAQIKKKTHKLNPYGSQQNNSQQNKSIQDDQKSQSLEQSLLQQIQQIPQSQDQQYQPNIQPNQIQPQFQYIPNKETSFQNDQFQQQQQNQDKYEPVLQEYNQLQQQQARQQNQNQQQPQIEKPQQQFNEYQDQHIQWKSIDSQFIQSPKMELQDNHPLVTQPIASSYTQQLDITNNINLHQQSSLQTPSSFNTQMQQTPYQNYTSPFSPSKQNDRITFQKSNIQTNVNDLGISISQPQLKNEVSANFGFVSQPDYQLQQSPNYYPDNRQTGGFPEFKSQFSFNLQHQPKPVDPLFGQQQVEDDKNLQKPKKKKSLIQVIKDSPPTSQREMMSLKVRRSKSQNQFTKDNEETSSSQKGRYNQVEDSLEQQDLSSNQENPDNFDEVKTSKSNSNKIQKNPIQKSKSPNQQKPQEQTKKKFTNDKGYGQLMNDKKKSNAAQTQQKVKKEPQPLGGQYNDDYQSKSGTKQTKAGNKKSQGDIDYLQKSGTYQTMHSSKSQKALQIDLTKSGSKTERRKSSERTKTPTASKSKKPQQNASTVVISGQKQIQNKILNYTVTQEESSDPEQQHMTLDFTQKKGTDKKKNQNKDYNKNLTKAYSTNDNKKILTNSVIRDPNQQTLDLTTGDLDGCDEPMFVHLKLEDMINNMSQQEISDDQQNDKYSQQKQKLKQNQANIVQVSSGFSARPAINQQNIINQNIEAQQKRLQKNNDY